MHANSVCTAAIKGEANCLLKFSQSFFQFHRSHSLVFVAVKKSRSLARLRKSQLVTICLFVSFAFDDF